jgi:hypothetical protein
MMAETSCLATPGSTLALYYARIYRGYFLVF